MPMYRDPTDKRARYESLRGALRTERATFDAHWQDLADFLMPRRTRFSTTDRNRGDKRNQNIIDSTGRFSARTLSSGLHAGLTSPARPWMKLTTPDAKLAAFGPVKQWLHVVTERMLTLFATSNLYNVLPLVYLDMGIFGTAAMSIVSDTRDLFRCYSYPIGSFALGQDKRGTVGTFVRDYQLSVRQVVEEFGVQPNGRDIDWSGISAATRALWDSGHYEAPVELCWMIKPNEQARRDRLASKFLPIASCHFERGTADDNRFLRESGFKTFPVMTPRWDITGEDSYGTDCPGMTALGDVRQLQIMQRRKGQAIAKQVDPPLVGPSSLRTQKTSLLPGDITYNDSREGMAGLRAIHEVRIDLSHLTADIGQVQYRIQRAFYEDLFLMLARSDDSRGAQPVTAREIDERHEEKLLALGPVLERTNDELLDPIVERVYQLMEDASMLPPPPPDLDGVQLRVEYISILSQAQKLVGVTGQDRFLQSAAGLAQLWPEVRHKIKVFQVVDNYADMLGVDPRIVVSDEDAQKLTDQERQAAQNAQDAAQAAQVAKATRDAAAAPMTGDSALSRIVASQSQQTIPPPATGSAPAVPPR